MAPRIKVKLVEWGEDIKVRIVTAGEDLELEVVSWGEQKRAKIVNWGEDKKAKLVGGGFFDDAVRIKQRGGGHSRLTKDLLSDDFTVRHPSGETSKLRKDVWGDWSLHGRDGTRSRVTKDFFGDGWTIHNPDGSRATVTKDTFGADWSLRESSPPRIRESAAGLSPEPADAELSERSPSSAPSPDPFVIHSAGASSEVRSLALGLLNLGDGLPTHYLDLLESMLQTVGRTEAPILCGRAWATRAGAACRSVYSSEGPQTSYYLVTSSAAYVPVTEARGRPGNHFVQRAPFARAATATYGASEHGFLTMDVWSSDAERLVGITFHPVPGNGLDEVEQAATVARAAQVQPPPWESSRARRDSGDGI